MGLLSQTDVNQKRFIYIRNVTTALRLVPLHCFHHSATGSRAHRAVGITIYLGTGSDIFRVNKSLINRCHKRTHARTHARTRMNVCMMYVCTDVAWRDVTWRVVTWRDVTWRDVTWRDVTWRDVTWRDVTENEVTTCCIMVSISIAQTWNEIHCRAL